MKNIFNYICVFISLIVNIHSAEARFSAYSALETIYPSGDILYKGYDYELYIGDDRILLNKKDITDLIDFITYSTSFESPIDILESINREDKNTLNKVHIYRQNPNSKEVIDALFYAAAYRISIKRSDKFFNKMEHYFKKGADINYVPLEHYKPQTALGLNICKNTRAANFLEKHGGKLYGDDNNDIISRCTKYGFRDEEELRSLLKHKNINWNKEVDKFTGNILNTKLSEGYLDPEVIDIFIKGGSTINCEGFHGALIHNQSSEVIRKMLDVNPSLATTPIIRKEEEHSFFTTHPRWVKVEIYPITEILETTLEGSNIWKLACKKECQASTYCQERVLEKRKIIDLLLKHGALPKTKKEKVLLDKILRDIPI